jgi:hypothetical protein
MKMVKKRNGWYTVPEPILSYDPAQRALCVAPTIIGFRERDIKASECDKPQRGELQRDDPYKQEYDEPSLSPGKIRFKRTGAIIGILTMLYSLSGNPNFKAPESQSDAIPYNPVAEQTTQKDSGLVIALHDPPKRGEIISFEEHQRRISDQRIFVIENAIR